MKMDIELVESFIIDTKTRLAKMNNNSRREKKTILKCCFFGNQNPSVDKE